MAGQYQASTEAEARAWSYALSFYELEISARPDERYVTMKRPATSGRDEISDDEGPASLKKKQSSYMGLLSGR